jgi:acyl-CoA reductase-like NAD-dependent aldehyde dehydrogenase
VLYHRPEDAAKITTALIEHPAIKKVNFTGSTAVGRIIASTAGKNLKPVLMELGGKNNSVIFADADLDKAAHQCALGSFLHSGQICMATDRILVAKEVRSAFIEKFKKAVDQVFGGKERPALVLAQAAGVEKNRRLIAEAVKRGAQVIHGDHEKEEPHPENPNGVSKTRLRPIIVDGVTKDMEIFYTESFGPCVSIVEFESEEQAVELANDTEYGLSGAVFTQDLAKGLRVARQIESGYVFSLSPFSSQSSLPNDRDSAIHINAMTVHDESNLPHGGAKMSGWGRFNGNWGLEEFLRIKTITYQE